MKQGKAIWLKGKAYELVLSNIEGFFGEMSMLTNTLWEYRPEKGTHCDFKGSQDHGFASYVIVVIQKALKHRR